MVAPPNRTIGQKVIALVVVVLFFGGAFLIVAAHRPAFELANYGYRAPVSFWGFLIGVAMVVASCITAYVAVQYRSARDPEYAKLMDDMRQRMAPHREAMRQRGLNRLKLLPLVIAALGLIYLLLRARH